MIETEDLQLLSAEWKAGVEPILTVNTRVSTTDRTANLTTPTVPPPLDAHVLDRFLRPTKLIPTDAMVKTKADAITRGQGTDFERARAIYDWVVARTAVDSDTRVDPNVLVVHLARTSAIPARCAWGLGLASSNATKAQEGRPQGYLTR